MDVPHPYANQRKLTAWPRNEGNLFSLCGKQTYYYKEKIKQLGGEWTGREWIVTKEAVRELNCLVMIRVKIPAQCHEPEEETWATSEEIRCGKMRVGCSFCDTPAICGNTVEILNIDEARKQVKELLG